MWHKHVHRHAWRHVHRHACRHAYQHTILAVKVYKDVLADEWVHDIERLEDDTLHRWERDLRIETPPAERRQREEERLRENLLDRSLRGCGQAVDRLWTGC